MKLEEIFKKCLVVSLSKRQDYTSSTDNHENFKRSSEIASWFSDKEDKSYAVLIGTKLARLGSLLSSNRTPNNESIDDTFLDLVNYCALWMERRTNQVYKNLPTPIDPLTCERCIIDRFDYREQLIDHSIAMHGAVYYQDQNLLKFSDGSIRLLVS